MSDLPNPFDIFDLDTDKYLYEEVLSLKHLISVVLNSIVKQLCHVVQTTYAALTRSRI